MIVTAITDVTAAAIIGVTATEITEVIATIHQGGR